MSCSATVCTMAPKNGSTYHNSPFPKAMLHTIAPRHGPAYYRVHQFYPDQYSRYMFLVLSHTSIAVLKPEKMPWFFQESMDILDMKRPKLTKINYTSYSYSIRSQPGNLFSIERAGHRSVTLITSFFFTMYTTARHTVWFGMYKSEIKENDPSNSFLIL